MKNKKGFTLIELLAVIVILGLLMAIAIPSVTKYITESRKKTVVSTIGNYITAMVNEVNDLTYTFTGDNTIYAVPIECISLERGGTDPFGEWHQSNDAYWAYVLVQYDDETSSYIYGYTFKDSAGYGLYPTTQAKLNEQGKQIQTGLSLSRPKNGKITTITSVDNWSGFKVDSSTKLKVLITEMEGINGDSINTCTLYQKGNNYQFIEETRPKCLAISDLGLNIGGEIKCGEEKFFIIENNITNIVMLTDEKILIDNEPNVHVGAGLSWFSFHNYWTDSIDGKYQLKPKYGTNYPAYVFEKNGEIESTYKYVNEYEKKLNQMGIISAKASLISHEQLTMLGCDISSLTCINSPHRNLLVRNYDWWTGSAFSSTAQDNLFIVRSDGSLYRKYRIYGSAVRPIVTIDVDEILY